MSDNAQDADDVDHGTAPCPNCRKEGLKTVGETKHECQDRACPVIEYDYRGKYE